MLPYKKKIFIDRTFGMVAAFVLNILTRFIGIILCRDHGIPQHPKVVVVAKIVGLGSIVHSGVLCRALKITFPETRLVYVTSIGCREFVSRMNYVDEICTINDRGLAKMVCSAALLIYKLWKIRPELYFDLELYSSWSSIIATLSLARNRYGFFRKSTAFRLGLHSHLLFFNTNKYLSDIYLLLGKSAGAEGSNDLQGLLNIRTSDRETCAQFLQQLGLHEHGYVVINPNASDLLLERRWPVEKWKLFLDIATEVWPNLVFLLVGSPSEKSYVEQIYNNLLPESRKNVMNVAGLLPLGGYLALIEKCRAMVTCDSGPLHFSISLDRPTLSLWGPGNPQHYGTVKTNHKIIYEPIYCSPCLYHADYPPCTEDNQCLKGIPVRTVLEAFALLINIPLPEEALLDSLRNNEIHKDYTRNNTKVLGLVQR